MKNKQKGVYLVSEQLKDILKRVLENFTPKGKMKPFKTLTVNEQPEKEA